MAKGFDNTDKFIKSLNQSALRAITRASNIVKNDAILNAPHDTGALKRSIKTEIKGEGKNIIGQIGTNLDYAIFVEKGTGEFAENGQGRKTPWKYQNSKGQWVVTTGQKPQPFLEPALKDNVEKIKKIIKEEMKGVSS